MLRQRLEGAEEMHRAIAGGEVDGFVVGRSDEERRIMLLEGANPHYGQMVQRIQQGATTVSCAGEILYANQRFAAMLGEPLAALFSAALQQYIADTDRERVEKFLAAGVPDSSIDVTLRRRPGGTLLVRLDLVSFGDAHASLLVTDLSSRERLEEAEGAVQAIRHGEIDGIVVGDQEIMLVGHAHRPYQAMVDRMHQGAVTVLSDGEVVYVNDRFTLMAGITRERLLGHPLAGCFAPSAAAGLKRMLERCSVASAQAELELARPDASTLPVFVTGAPLDDTGAITLVLTDLTEQRRHREIEEAGQRKDEFLAVLAHELRNPLAPIRNAVEVLRRAPELSSTARQAVDIIARQSTTLTRLLDDLLDINRLNQGKITLQCQSVDLKAVIAGAVEAAQPLLQERHHTLELELSPEELRVEGDPVRVAQVVLNLLSNAAKYTRQGGRIRVVLRPERGAAGEPRAVIRVCDSGIGIPAHLLRKIFEPYTQLSDPAGAVTGGLGLGLTVSRRLIELHDGSITATSAGPGQGSEFVVELPLASGPPPIASAVDETTGASTGRSGMRILVADDNADSVASLAMLLEMSGHETRTARDGIEALGVADEFRPDIAFLDIGMPNLDGYATARELRAKPWARELAIFALTGWGQPEDKLRAQEAGFDTHLVKPIDPDVLQQLISSRRNNSRA